MARLRTVQVDRYGVGRDEVEQALLGCRAGLFANALPANAPSFGANTDVHSFPVGWTAQEPWVHHRSRVPLRCLLCARALEQRQWTNHACLVVEVLS